MLVGDGRNDSPGHSSQYCTYTLMEHDSNSILSVQVVDKTEVQGKSTNMEKLGAKLGLCHVLDAGVEIAQFVTDAHVQIGALMSKHKIYFKWILNDCSFITHIFFSFLQASVSLPSITFVSANGRQIISRCNFTRNSVLISILWNLYAGTSVFTQTSQDVD